MLSLSTSLFNCLGLSSTNITSHSVHAHKNWHGHEQKRLAAFLQPCVRASDAREVVHGMQRFTRMPTAWLVIPFSIRIWAPSGFQGSYNSTWPPVFLFITSGFLKEERVFGLHAGVTG
ncbi:hypothetical protein BJX70DRAFT_368151 [Aspergillus crustosus]